MRPYRMPKRTKAIVTALAAAAVLSGPVFAEETSVASAAENIGEGAAMNLIQPVDPDSGYTLPPLSDHILLAQANEDQVAVPQDNGQGALGEDDGTAKQYNRGYYTELVQIAQLVLVPATLEEIEAGNVSDDRTAQQFDRGYYKEPEIVALIILLPSERTIE